MKLAAGQALSVFLRDGHGAGIALSPFHLPLRTGVLRAPPLPFSGLFGLFDDSLPDGWGLLLQDRRATQLGCNPASLTPLDRLGQVGRTAIGALAYEPELTEPLAPGPVDLDAAYDLTLSEGPAGDHSMALAGRGDPDLDAVLAVAGQVGIDRTEALDVVREVSEVVIDGARELPHRVASRLRPLR